MPILNLTFKFEAELVFVANYVCINFIALLLLTTNLYRRSH